MSQQKIERNNQRVLNLEFEETCILRYALGQLSNTTLRHTDERKRVDRVRGKIDKSISEIIQQDRDTILEALKLVHGEYVSERRDVKAKGFNILQKLEKKIQQKHTLNKLFCELEPKKSPNNT